jgi:O-Antigen ligase
MKKSSLHNTDEYAKIVESYSQRKVSDRRERFVLMAFFLGMTSVFEVNIVGKLMGTDVVCILGAVYTLFRRPPEPLAAYTKILMLLVVVWCFGAVATDIYRGSAFADVARGQSRIIILFLGLFFLSDISGGSANWPASFLLGLNIGVVSKGMFFDGYGFRAAPWKFGLGIGCAAICIILLERFKPRSFHRQFCAVIAFLMLAVFSLYSNARSLFAVFALVSVAVLARKRLYAFVFRRGANPLAMIVLTLLSIGIAQGVSATYAYFAETGALGEQAKQKFENQRALGLNDLQSGRQESLVSLQAIADSPILGHGSWAHDPKYVEMLVTELKRRGMKQVGSLGQEDIIPSHSQILGAWVDHGILAVPFWLFAAYVLLQGMKRAIEPDCMHREMILLFAMLAFWNLFFSPFGAQERVSVAAVCAIVIAERRARTKASQLRTRAKSLSMEP